MLCCESVTTPEQRREAAAELSNQGASQHKLKVCLGQSNRERTLQYYILLHIHQLQGSKLSRRGPLVLEKRKDPMLNIIIR